MTLLPLQAGEESKPEVWRHIERRAIFEFCKWDIQCEDHSVLSHFPLFIESAAAEHLNGLAEALTREALAAETEILQKPLLLERLGVPQPIRKVLRESTFTEASPRNLRVMRFDFHPTPDGWRISEINADVPGGFIEASGWNSLFAECVGACAPPNTSQLLADALLETAGAKRLVALVHATAYSDDRQVMQHLARVFRSRGLNACLLSPSHLSWVDGRAEISSCFASGSPDSIVRFFPAEWLPNLASRKCWWPYFQEMRTPLSNPGSAIVLQTKRFPLVWNDLETRLSSWRTLLPETREFKRPEDFQDDRWVLKPALGRVGEGIGIRGITPPSKLSKIIQDAKRSPETWVLQKRFSILPVMTEAGEQFPCIGVFTIGGKAAGLYGRISESPIINQHARDAAVLIRQPPEGRA